METNRRKILTAYIVLSRMAQEPMSSFTAYKLYKLMGVLKPEWDIQVELENRLIERLKPKFVNGSTLTFSENEEADEWRSQIAELNEAESDISFEAVHIPINDDMKLSPEDIEALDGFVIFDE
jgi:hypothetical protein